MSSEIAVNADFRFLHQFFSYKIDDRRKGAIFGDDFRPKIGFLVFTAKRTRI